MAHKGPRQPQAAHCLCSLGIYGLPLLPLSGLAVATTALPSLFWPLFLDLRGSKGPNAQEVCAQSTFEGGISPRDKWQEMGLLREAM